ncbi:MAG: lipid-A-disaccharide synthase [Brevinematia bacterium]
MDIVKNKLVSIEVFFSAGEVSGDISASEVIEELVKIGIRCTGVGGPKMIESGMINITGTDESISSAVGFSESLKYIFPKLILLRKIVNYLKKNHPNLVVLVDNQGFNIPFAKICKKMGLKIVYYFPPMVSVWNENVKYKIAKYCDKIICTFKDDYEIYHKVSDNAVFVGNPIVDRVVKNYSSKEKYLDFFTKGKKKILLLPGSRKQEVRRLFTPMLETVKCIVSGKSNLNANEFEFYTIVSHGAFTNYIINKIQKFKLDEYVKVFDNPKDFALYDICDLAIVTSGTVTLELALLEKPAIVLYKVSKLTFEIGKRVVRSKFISLPNILLGEQIYPELLQNKVNPRNILALVETMLDENYIKTTKDKLEKIKNEYKPGAIDKTVKEIKKCLGLS